MINYVKRLIILLVKLIKKILLTKKIKIWKNPFSKTVLQL